MGPLRNSACGAAKPVVPHISGKPEPPPTFPVAKLSWGTVGTDTGSFQQLHTWLLADEPLWSQEMGWNKPPLGWGCPTQENGSKALALARFCIPPHPALPPACLLLPFSSHPLNPIQLRPDQGWVTRQKSQESPEPRTRIRNGKTESLCKRKLQSDVAFFFPPPLFLLPTQPSRPWQQLSGESFLIFHRCYKD